MGCDDNLLYPFRKSCDSELSNALGKDDPYQIESNRITRGYCVPFGRISDGQSPQSPETAVSGSTTTYETSCGPSLGAHQQSQQSTPLSTCLGDSASTGPTPGPFNAVSHPLSFGGHGRNVDYDMVHGGTGNNDSTYDVTTGLETGGFSAPRVTVLSMAQGVGQEPQYAEESVSEAVQGGYQGICSLPFPVLPRGASENPLQPEDHPTTGHYPSDSNRILGFLKRNDRGGATCLWAGKGGTCGFFSQVDLVKRHIKRMHYRSR